MLVALPTGKRYPQFSTCEFRKLRYSPSVGNVVPLLTLKIDSNISCVGGHFRVGIDELNVSSVILALAIRGNPLELGFDDVVRNCVLVKHQPWSWRWYSNREPLRRSEYSYCRSHRIACSDRLYNGKKERLVLVPRLDELIRLRVTIWFAKQWATKVQRRRTTTCFMTITESDAVTLSDIRWHPHEVAVHIHYCLSSFILSINKWNEFSTDSLPDRLGRCFSAFFLGTLMKST